MIEKALIIALGVFFLHATTWEGMLNEWVNRAAFRFPAWLKKILYDCPVCMAPWYGAALMLSGVLRVDSLTEGALILAAAGGVNAVLIFFIPFWGDNEDAVN